jgi:chromosome segregation ATPase
MVQSYQDTREGLAEAQSQVDATLGTLAQLRTAPAPAMNDVFRQYKDQVTKLEREKQTAQWRAQTMRDEQDAHIKAWEKEMASIKDPSIHSTLESRRQATRSNFKFVQMYADDIKKRYEPFLQGNKDIVQALSIDLSPTAIASLSGSIDKVMKDGLSLKERITSMRQALDNIANGVSPMGQ